MRRIANTDELQTELGQILAYSQSERPSRTRIASELERLSVRLAGFNGRDASDPSLTKQAAGATQDFPDGAGPNTPWGKAQSVHTIARGVRWVSTAGHGGLGVAAGVAIKALSPAARKLGDLSNGYFWFEEDCKYALAFYEHPEWDVSLTRLSGGRAGSKEQHEQTIKRWYPEYFEMSGLVDKPKLRVGMTVKCIDNKYYKSSVALGSVWTIEKVTSSSFVAHGDGGIFRFKVGDYNNDMWEVLN